MGGIDRTKQDIDVMERVLGAAQDEEGPEAEVIDLSVRPWLGGATTTAVQIRVGVNPHRDDEPGRRRD